MLLYRELLRVPLNRYNNSMQKQQNINPQQLLADSRIMIDAGSVQQAVDRWAAAINQDLAGQLDGRTLITIAVMRGGMLPAAWLIQRLKLPLFQEYVHATRYRSGTSGHQLEWKHRPALQLQDQPVLIIDDIFDEGYTLEAIRDWCREEGASKVLTAALVRKQHQRGLSREWLDYAGLDIPDEYVFGCGMDIYEHWRHLPDIWAYQPGKGD